MFSERKKLGPKKWMIGLVLFCFFTTQVAGGVLMFPKPAKAQMVVSDPITGAQTTIRNVQDFLKILVVNAGTMALVNAATRFMQKIAYDLAVSLASGGSGQMPLFSTKGWGDYFADTALDATGEFIGSFGEAIGVDLCAPPNPQLGLTLQLNLAGTYAGELPPPTCAWSDIKSNWDSFISEVQTEEFLYNMASQFKVGYGTGSNDMDLAMTGILGAFNVRQSATEIAGLTREEGQGFLPLTELISGDVKTPAEVIRQASQLQTEAPVKAEELRWSMSSNALSQGAQGILSMFVSTFVNTLLNKAMQQIFTKGMHSLADLFPKGEGTTEEGTTWGGRRAAELAFADLLTPQIKEGGMYDILGEFIVCPEKFRGPNNCVMDGNFEASVRQAQTGDPLTVKEAIDQNLLHYDWPLIPPSDAKNQDPFCYTYGYCYSNLTKMRKARVIPIGWEIAALSSTSSNPVRLGEVVAKFNDCNDEGKADDTHKYCHLIDPNWILKAPPSQCRARVYGPLLQTAENSFRQEICVDSPTCLAEDDNGNCEGGWGYCLREKNIWRLNGDRCEAQYDTCRALQSRSGQTVSYLVNTIDYGPPCTSEDVGCQWYSTRQDKEGDSWVWQDDLTGSGVSARRNDRIFFNKNIVQCGEPGCNEFLKATKGTKANYITNSSFEDSEGTPPIFSGWTVAAGTGEPSPDTYFNRTALKLTGSVTQTVDLGAPRGGKTFVISLYAKNCGEESSTDFFTFGGVPVSGGNFESTTSYLRLIGPTHTFPAGDTNTTIEVLIRNEGADCLIDAVQLEEGAITAYHEGWGKTGEAVYMTSAPDYYACYDYNTDGSLNKTNDAEACADFTKACEEKDVGCEQFTPANGDPWVPGVATYPDDYCPKECVGYQTFKQVSTDFEQEKFPVYFIPDSAKTCNAADNGCDQFTSLETEAITNFTYIRRCEKPGETSAVFYTWEGSDTTGVQLKTWNLKASDVDNGPCTKLDPTNADLCADDGATGVCAEADTIATSLTYNPDCREFYDRDGSKHYRLYSKTIIVTDDCHTYRKTISNATDCGTSGGRWDITRNQCTYQVYLSESRTCSASAVGCRTYRGNAGANVAIILNNDFESGDVTDWGAAPGIVSSSESLTTEGKSMSIALGTMAAKDVSGSIRKGGIYTLSFWAKGNSKLNIKFSGAPGGREFSVNDTDSTTPTAELSFDWRYFSLGPVYITWDPASDEKLQITPSGGTIPAYIDNLVLREVQDYIYLIKDSWTTPAQCDRTFLVDFTVTNEANCSAIGGAWQEEQCITSAALPQAQLGCALYYDRASREHYLKSFLRLCSPDAAGCERLVKTQNNTTIGAEEFNTANDSDLSLSEEERYSDNVTLPPDKEMFLIVNDQYQCAAGNRGCTSYGAPTLDASGNVKVGEDGKPIYNSVNLLADPARFVGDTGKILCEVQYQGCEEYRTTEGGNLYFKDPGARTCEWKENIIISGRSVTGWFKKGTNPAEPCDPMNFYGGIYNIWKNGDVRCTLPTVCNATLTATLATTCADAAGCPASGGGREVCRVLQGQRSCTYPNPAGCSCVDSATGSTCTVQYGKRTCPYSGWVGECPTTANMCTRYIDPSDTKNSDEGESYYYIKNDKLTSGNCNGMVSQRDGCVLLNDTSVTQLNYNANLTYSSSEKKRGDPGGLVSPVVCPLSLGTTTESCKICVGRSGSGVSYGVGGVVEHCTSSADCPGGTSCNNLIVTPFTPRLNNSNTLLQVRRDRACGEWIDCTSTNSTFDAQTGRQKTLCEQLGVCTSYAKSGEATQCLDWNDEPDTYRKALTKDLYTKRDVSWKGMEYTGDSIYNQYQAADLQGVNIGTETNPKNVLAFVDDRCFDAADPARERVCVASPPGYCDSDVNGSRCGEWGKCYNHLCVTNFRGDPTQPDRLLFVDNNPEAASCRAYPEQSSPFPTTVVAKWGPSGAASEDLRTDLVSKKPGFSGANVCERQFANICVGGPNAGDFCTIPEDCREPGGTEGNCEKKELPNACECNYKKVSYSGGAVTKYFSSEIDKLGVVPSVCVGGTTPGKICSNNTDCGGNKTCAGGTNAGKTCNTNSDCAPDGTCIGDGQCTPSQREDTVQGWQGYCLERDTAISINGSPDKFACLTWYPIDQLPGVPDMYNQYTEAGFSMADVSYCLKPNVYYTKQKHPFGDGYYCANQGPGEVTWCTSSVSYARDQCLKPAVDRGEIRCSKDEWIIMGECGSSHNPSLCDGPSYDNDCPYHCVPKHSVHTEAGGTACSIDEIVSSFTSNYETARGDYWTQLPAGDCSRSLGANGCAIGRYKDYDYVIVSYGKYNRTWLKDCEAQGVPASATIGGSSVSTLSRGTVGTYLACETAVKVAGEPNDNKAWTDNLWETRRYAISITESSLAPYLAYMYPSVIQPFGREERLPIVGDSNADIYSIPTCQKSDASELRLKTTALSCDSGFTPLPDDQVPNEARSYAGISVSLSTSRPGPSCTTDAECNAMRYCREVACSKVCRSDTDCPSGYTPCTIPEGATSGYCRGLAVSDPFTAIEPADCSGIFGGTYEKSGRCGTSSSSVPTDKSCTASSDCKDWICDSGRCRTSGEVTPIGAGSVILEPGWPDSAKKRLGQIFAATFGGLKWVWDPAAALDNPTYVTDSIGFNISSKSTAAPGGLSWPIPPQIYALGPCIGDKCRQGIPNSVTINGIDGNGLTSTGFREPVNVVGYGGKLKATLQFFGEADKNSMPIRSVAKDWGDAPPAPPADGRYKNHLGLKEDNSSQCDNSTFGRSENACTDSYFYYTHVYSCPKDAATSIRSCDVAPGGVNCYAASCPENVNGAQDGNGSCCVFKPKVQIKDNWGWCNGDCGRASGGCYDASPVGSNECDVGETRYNHWTEFEGLVIVVPK